jgi:hypothetical protein
MAFSPFSTFSLAINYPWLAYGEDFGCVRGSHRGVSAPPNQELLLREFSRIRETGATVVRWFLFGDGRGGFVSENGIPRKPDEFLFKDLSAALRIARQTQLQICFSLMDYLWLQEHAGKRPPHAHEHVLHFAAGREAFLQRVLIPLFREFRGNPAILAWEVANEPEWAIREFHRAPEATLHVGEFRAFAAEITRAIHEFAARPATLGCARLIWLKAWAELGLDFCDAHYYPSCEQDTRLDLAQMLAALPPLDKPLCIGELPAQDPAHPEYSCADALRVCREAGLAGAGVWRWTKPEAGGADSRLGCIDPALLRACSAPTLDAGPPAQPRS